MTERRVAVFVDGDNVSARYSDCILSQAEKLGRVDVLRVYASLSVPCNWDGIPGYRLIHSGSGKNATDMLLCIDAVELAVNSNISAVVIASSDRDFTHLAHRLRERGIEVLGLGESKAHEQFRKACASFRELAPELPEAVPEEARTLEPTPENSETPKASNPAASKLDRKIRDMIAQHGTNGSGMSIAALGPLMHKAHGTRISTQPERTWRAYLAARTSLYDLDPRGPNAKVRYRKSGFGPP